jgi:hypothetical protein
MAGPRDAGFDALTLAGYRTASLFAKLAPSPLALGASLALGAPLSLGMRDKRAMIERHLQRVNPALKGFALRQARVVSELHALLPGDFSIRNVVEETDSGRV